MRATGTVLVLVPGLSGVVMRAAFTVHMLSFSFSFGGVVMRAAFAVFVLMPGFFGSVIMRAALAVLVGVSSFLSGGVVGAARAVFVLVFLCRGICRIHSRVGQSGYKS